MDGKNVTPSVRKDSQVGDDQVGGCCVFFRSRRKKTNRQELFRRRVKEQSSNTTRKGVERHNSEERAIKGADRIDDVNDDAIDVTQTTPSNSHDVEAETSQLSLDNTVLSLNKTIEQLYDTLGECIELNDKFEYDEAIHNKSVHLELTNLDDGVQLVGSIVQKVIREQKQANDGTALEGGALATIGRGLVIICEAIKPALKNFLIVAASISSVCHAVEHPLTFV